MPGLSGKIENGKQTIIVKNLEVKNDAKGVNLCTSFGRINTDGTILGNYNIASVNHTSTGIYDITFTTPMNNTNYSVVAMCNGSGDMVTTCGYNMTTTGYTIELMDSNNQLIDKPFSFQVFGGL